MAGSDFTQHDYSFFHSSVLGIQSDAGKGGLFLSLQIWDDDCILGPEPNMASDLLSALPDIGNVYLRAEIQLPVHDYLQQVPTLSML